MLSYYKLSNTHPLHTVLGDFLDPTTAVEIEFVPSCVEGLHIRLLASRAVLYHLS